MPDKQIKCHSFINSLTGATLSFQHLQKNFATTQNVPLRAGISSSTKQLQFGSLFPRGHGKAVYNSYANPDVYAQDCDATATQPTTCRAYRNTNRPAPPCGDCGPKASFADCGEGCSLFGGV